MSRYVVTTAGLHDLRSVADALARLGIEVERGADRVMLAASLECAGEPVDLRVPAGTLGAVADFGFCLADHGPTLVCSDVDEALLRRELLPALQVAVAQVRLDAAASRLAAEVDVEIAVAPDERLHLRRR